MMEWTLPYERSLFFALNGGLPSFLDKFMWIVTGKLPWVFLLSIYLILLFYKKNWKDALLLILFIAITITLCDQITSGFLKPLVARFRPTHHPDFATNVIVSHGYRGGRYGFASSHAANFFGFAVFTSLFLKKRLYTVSMLCCALLVSYTRIYLGVHFPTDVLAGAIIGILSAYFAWFFYTRAKKFLVARQKLPVDRYSLSSKEIKLLLISLYGMMLFLLCFSIYFSL